VIRPEFVKKTPAGYPTRAWNARIEGTVVVNALIDENGKVADTQLLQRIEHPLGTELNNAAVISVRSSTFRAATKDGVKVKAWLPIPIVFRIRK
jgi:protein TonB